MTTEEKRKLGAGLTRLSPDDLNKAIEIIAQKNPNLNPTAEEVDLDIDAQVNYHDLCCFIYLFYNNLEDVK